MNEKTRIIKVGSGKIRGCSVTVKEKDSPLKIRQAKDVCQRQRKLKYAEHLKKTATESELTLYSAMKKRGYVFEFQAVVYGYIPDFYFRELNWIVELDGKRFHDNLKDEKRDADLLKCGIRTLRIQSRRVFTNLRNVLNHIARTVYGSQIAVRKKKRGKPKVGKRKGPKYPYEKGLRYEKAKRK